MRMQGSENPWLRGVGALALFAFSLAPRLAHADEPVKGKEFRTLSEPGEVTNVIDAFDDDDPFDLSFTLGYQYSSKTARITRETYINDAANPGFSTGGFIADTMNVARYSETTSRLNTRVDFGVYKDIALFLRMPIVLSNDRQLDDLDGSIRQQDVILQGAPGERLFTMPFKSPQRSGIEYLAVGIDVGIMNQWRDPSKPTWIIGFESRFSVSEPMHACNENPSAGQVRCAHPADIDRNGQSGGAVVDGIGSLEGHGFSGERKPGISRGTTTLVGHTMLSKRIKYVEPYGGFRTLVELPNSSSDFAFGDTSASIVNLPPIEGQVILGMQVIPYENREEFQRVTVDFRVQTAYRSEGRDYSELFDALGSSAVPSLRNPIWASYHAQDGQSVVNPSSQKVYFTGLTNVQAHGKVGLSASVTWQAAEYIKFQLGAGYTHVQGHLITAEQPCNPSLANDPGAAGPCKTTAEIGNQRRVTVTGAPNPNFRQPIDTTGRRFKVDDINLWDGWLNAVVMF